MCDAYCRQPGGGGREKRPGMSVDVSQGGNDICAHGIACPMVVETFGSARVLETFD